MFAKKDWAEPAEVDSNRAMWWAVGGGCELVQSSRLNSALDSMLDRKTITFPNRLFDASAFAMVLLVIACFALSSTNASAEEIDFSKEILPVLSENCFKCFG